MANQSFTYDLTPELLAYLGFIPKKLWNHGKEETEWWLTLIQEGDEYIPTDKPQGGFVDFIITEHQYLQRDYATRSKLGLCRTLEELMHYFQHQEINVPYYRIPLASHKTTGERQLPELNNGELKFGHVVYSRSCTGEMSLICSYYPCLHPGNGHSFWYGVPLTEHVLQCIGFERWPERQFRRGDDTVQLNDNNSWDAMIAHKQKRRIQFVHELQSFYEYAKERSLVLIPVSGGWPSWDID